MRRTWQFTTSIRPGQTALFALAYAGSEHLHARLVLSHGTATYRPIKLHHIRFADGAPGFTVKIRFNSGGLTGLWTARFILHTSSGRYSKTLYFLVKS